MTMSTARDCSSHSRKPDEDPTCSGQGLHVSVSLSKEGVFLTLERTSSVERSSVLALGLKIIASLKGRSVSEFEKGVC